MMDTETATNGGAVETAPPAARRFQFDPAPRQVRVSPRYSRFVGMMKLLLPVLALGLMVAVVIWPNEFSETTGFHLSYAAPEDGSAVDLVMLQPRYLGTDARNHPFVVTADRAVQDPNDQRLITLSHLQADMSMADGQWFTILADTGIYHQLRQHLRLQGAINLFSDQGYEFNASVIEIDLNIGRATTDLPVRGQGPFGSLRADRLMIEDFGQRLYFQGNVKMRAMAPGRS
ncbi:MAG: LPS export ABC transporter periplasmic protein LptC [Alphaproteobacteria bacterium]|nr:LPS export ABC transporter periplasmic protein LptC [Alphaproteobacteria bacterium]MBL6954735.1 LPS export ABC transporter periplasmic protein LptC [Alphaproteobacteria bacterium]